MYWIEIRTDSSYLGYSIKELPKNMALEEEVTFSLQDGWLNPTKPTLDLKPRMAKMRPD
ncbi:hypothetical protein [Pseudomonas protegens]|uniref:hypothetical protein n=1 Tax=Pseudomonas protegens TaxID=380021 RepID=UPI0015E0A991|nr:hypothetical protein [Pseudomonas protegens]